MITPRLASLSALIVFVAAFAPMTRLHAQSAARHILTRAAAVAKANRCLEAIADSGASDESLANAHGYVRLLAATRAPYAGGLANLLSDVLAQAYPAPEMHPARMKNISTFGGVAGDLAYRAAAACAIRASRHPGEIVISFAGDCTFGAVNGDGGPGRFPSVYRRAHEIDYPFHLVRPWFVDDDLTVVNFECTLTEASREANKQWHFKGAASYASIFPASSVELAGLANNHSMDYLQQGFDDTVRNFTRAGVPVFYQNAPYVTTLQGVQTVLIGDCTVIGENTTHIDGTPGRVLAQIKRYKRPDNLVIVVMHWGNELNTAPHDWQQTLGHEFIDAGADAVVGGHPHVLQGIESYHGKTIAYSLGNFAFGGNSMARNPDTIILRLTFREVGGVTTPLAPSVVPCYITSTNARNSQGALINNYQPRPLFGDAASQTIGLLLARSAKLPNGVRSIDYLKVR